MKNLKRILELIRKTGDRFLIEDEDGNLFVVLSSNDYETLVVKKSQLKNFSEEELLNKINKDIAIWKASQEDKNILSEWSDFQEEDSINQEDQYYFEAVEDEE